MSYVTVYYIYFSCGKAAKEQSYKYFCVEHYGECYGFNQFDLSQPQAGPKKCWGQRPVYDQCDHELPKPICVGTPSHGYVYELQVDITVIKEMRNETGGSISVKNQVANYGSPSSSVR